MSLADLIQATTDGLLILVVCCLAVLALGSLVLNYYENHHDKS